MASLTERAQAEGAAITITILNSFYMGTQTQEIIGDAKFEQSIALPDSGASRYPLICQHGGLLYIVG